MIIIRYIIDLLWFALLAQVVASWLVVAGVRNPLVMRLYYSLSQLLEPLMGPIRRVIPPIGAFDLTPLILFIILGVLRRMLA